MKAIVDSYCYANATTKAALAAAVGTSRQNFDAALSSLNPTRQTQAMIARALCISMEELERLVSLESLASDSALVKYWEQRGVR